MPNASTRRGLGRSRRFPSPRLLPFGSVLEGIHELQPRGRRRPASPFVARADRPPQRTPSRTELRLAAPLIPGRRHGRRRGAPPLSGTRLALRARTARPARASARSLHACADVTLARLHGSRARKRGIQGRNAQQQTLYEEYAPYGTSAYRSAKSGVEVSARRYRYTGKERDDETGLYYYGARYYAAWLGRWTSADPLGIGADGPGVYNYVRGSPVVYSDPSGMESWSEETVQRHADRRPPPRPAQEPKAEPEVPDDLTTGQTIDPRIDVGVPDAVPPELAFANEIRANIGALLAAERRRR
ncbi:MAG: RHS repeat-associated core domain-containing protein [Polyangiaceae bacterium]|nr:RHS repeat-associated core domain-containing protein [Polyangiaceae bacterium]